MHLVIAASQATITLYSLDTSTITRYNNHVMSIEQLVNERCSPEWREVVHLTILTGCSACERRLVEDDHLREDVLLVQSNYAVPYVLCDQCAKSQTIEGGHAWSICG